MLKKWHRGCHFFLPLSYMCGKLGDKTERGKMCKRLREVFIDLDHGVGSTDHL